MISKTYIDPPSREKCPTCLKKRKWVTIAVLGFSAISGVVVGDVAGMTSLLMSLLP